MTRSSPPGTSRAVLDKVELEEVYTTERHLLNVAGTRGRKSLTITAVFPESGS